MRPKFGFVKFDRFNKLIKLKNETVSISLKTYRWIFLQI